jgi:hypothetical protein
MTIRAEGRQAAFLVAGKILGPPIVEDRQGCAVRRNLVELPGKAPAGVPAGNPFQVPVQRPGDRLCPGFFRQPGQGRVGFLGFSVSNVQRHVSFIACRLDAGP